jgi:hypothetical protein
MRVKFEATDATGKVHKRSSMSHVYSHCVVIHFAALVGDSEHARRDGEAEHSRGLEVDVEARP